VYVSGNAFLLRTFAYKLLLRRKNPPQLICQTRFVRHNWENLNLKMEMEREKEKWRNYMPCTSVFIIIIISVLSPPGFDQTKALQATEEKDSFKCKEAAWLPAISGMGPYQRETPSLSNRIGSLKSCVSP
jgi:hypothetical protein